MPLKIANPTTGGPTVDARGLCPNRLAGTTLAEIRKTLVFCGNRSVELGQLCRVDGEAASGDWRLEGDFSRWTSLGAEMGGGSIAVEGSVGRRAAVGMRRGRFAVHGNAGDWLGAEMTGGVIHVYGDAGNGVGAPLRGSRMGMNGGEIFVHGNVGDEAGAAMRRGLVAIAGGAGEFAGMRMLAGTLLVFGSCGRRPGAGMRRGTIGLFGDDRPTLSPTFIQAGGMRLPMLALFERRLKDAKLVVDPFEERCVDLYHGDMLELGRGEILVGS